MKRFSLLTVLVALLVLPSMLLAANKLALKEADVSEGLVTVPIEVSNLNGLMAMDLPLKFSEGVTLKEVQYGDRVDYFDLKIADIDNEKNFVAIGLITQIGPERRPDLAEGSGVVANLVFEVDDPSVTEITIEAVSTVDPDHDPVYIYEEYDGDQVIGQRVDDVRMDQVTLSLSGTGDALPTDYALGQNYPNPFNPDAVIEFSLPVASHYDLRVYNVLGQTVEHFSGDADAGTHQITFSGEGKASGVYFYKMTAGDFSDTKKMMLLK